MKEHLNFNDLMTIDATHWSKDIDPIGLLSYMSYKRKRMNLAEDADDELEEAMTLQQRMRRKILMRRLAPRIARARKIAMRRRAGTDVLKRRAKALARRTMAKKFLGGRNKSDVSPAERARVEKLLAKRKGGIEKLTARLLPKVRKAQALRFAKKTPAPAKSTPAPSPTPAK
jgi:hypothetical protein